MREADQQLSEQAFRERKGPNGILDRDLRRGKMFLACGHRDELSRAIFRLALAETDAIKRIRGKSTPCRIAFVGTGAACDSLISYSMLLEPREVVGFDNRVDAVQLAAENFAKFGTGIGSIVHACGTSIAFNSFDVVVVASYVAPKAAVFAAITQKGRADTVVAMRTNSSDARSIQLLSRQSERITVRSEELDVVTTIGVLQ